MQVRAKGNVIHKGITHMQGNIFEIEETEFDGELMERLIPINFSGTMEGAFITKPAEESNV